MFGSARLGWSSLVSLSSQKQFHADWGHLQDRHVRALAWLLTSPHLLQPHATMWPGTVVTPSLSSAAELRSFLTQLDQDPSLLHVALQRHPTKRLGLYAEHLLAFYFSAFYDVYAHGLQVHDEKARTIGEFDFLLRSQDGLAHWELATKFYLLFDDPMNPGGALDLYDFLGPNLADTLGAKMHKIIGQQLRLSAHPNAVSALDHPVTSVQALVKGWLFYRDPTMYSNDALVEGIARDHCRGYIWTESEIRQMDDFSAVILDRLMWLAPARVALTEVRDKQETLAQIDVLFGAIHSPVMLALLDVDGEYATEVVRGMVVPDDWWSQAAMARGRLKPGQST